MPPQLKKNFLEILAHIVAFNKIISLENPLQFEHLSLGLKNRVASPKYLTEGSSMLIHNLPNRRKYYLF